MRTNRIGGKNNLTNFRSPPLSGIAKVWVGTTSMVAAGTGVWRAPAATAKLLLGGHGHDNNDPS